MTTDERNATIARITKKLARVEPDTLTSIDVLLDFQIKVENEAVQDRIREASRVHRGWIG